MGDLAVRQLNGTLGLLLVAQGVLHPVLVVTLGVVLAGVGATRLLSRKGRLDGLGTRMRLES